MEMIWETLRLAEIYIIVLINNHDFSISYKVMIVDDE